MSAVNSTLTADVDAAASSDASKATSISITEPKVILEQTLLRVEEVYVYKIPPAYNGEHRAESWNLSHPLATCSLVVLRRDSSLFLQMFATRPKSHGPDGATESYLFCMSHIHIHNELASLKVDYWIQPVVDSSRYFALRITNNDSDSASSSANNNTNTKRREAWIGIGFRERNDAMNLKMSLQEYVHAMEKERTIWSLQQHQTAASLQSSTTSSSHCTYDDPSTSTDTHISLDIHDSIHSPLSLKEGQRIHVQIKGISTNTEALHNTYTNKGMLTRTLDETPNTNDNKHGKIGNTTAIKLLPPPPPPSMSPPTSLSLPSLVPKNITSLPNNHASIQSVVNSTTETFNKKPMHGTNVEEDDDDDEWNDFTSAT